MNSRMYTMGIVVALKNAFSANAKIIDRELRTLQKSLGMYTDEIKLADQHLAKLGLGFKSLVGGLAVLSTLRLPTKQFIEFQTAMAEVMTIADPATGSFNELAHAVERLSMAFGETPAKQAKALYQTISSGVLDSQQAIQLMETANKGAIAGIATSFEVVDVMTSIINAYQVSVAEATKISDQLFVAVKLGKTTMPELAAELGDVSAIAAMSGISIGEVTSAMATLTLTGQSTATAVTNLRGLLTNIIRPKKEALDMAEQLGINFNIDEVKKKGLFNFLMELGEAAKGNATVYGKFFRRIEGMNAVMALVGMKDKYKQVQDSIFAASEDTERAYKTIMNTTGKQLELLKSKVTVIMERIGSSLGVILMPSIKLLNVALLGVASAFQNIPILKYIVALPILIGGLTLVLKGLKDISFWAIKVGNLFASKWIVTKGFDPIMLGQLWSQSMRSAFASMKMPLLNLVALITFVAKAYTAAKDSVIKTSGDIKNNIFDARGILIQTYSELSDAQKEEYKATVDMGEAMTATFREANGELKGLSKSMYFVENLNMFERAVYNTSKLKEIVKIVKMLFGTLDEEGVAYIRAGTELHRYAEAYLGTNLWSRVEWLTQQMYRLNVFVKEFGKGFMKPFEYAKKAFEWILRLLEIAKGWLAKLDTKMGWVGDAFKWLYEKANLAPILGMIAGFTVFTKVVLSSIKALRGVFVLLKAIPATMLKIREVGMIKKAFDRAPDFAAVKKGYNYLYEHGRVNPLYYDYGKAHIAKAAVKSTRAKAFFERYGIMRGIQQQYGLDDLMPSAVPAQLDDMIKYQRASLLKTLGSIKGIKPNKLSNMTSARKILNQLNAIPKDSFTSIAQENMVASAKAELANYENLLLNRQMYAKNLRVFNRVQSGAYAYTPHELTNMRPESAQRLYDDISRGVPLDSEFKLGRDLQAATQPSRLTKWWRGTSVGQSMGRVTTRAKDRITSPFRKIKEAYLRKRGLQPDKEFLAGLDKTLGVEAAAETTGARAVAEQIAPKQVTPSGAIDSQKLSGTPLQKAATTLQTAGKQLMTAASKLSGGAGLGSAENALKENADEISRATNNSANAITTSQVANSSAERALDQQHSITQNLNDKANTAALQGTMVAASNIEVAADTTNTTTQTGALIAANATQNAIQTSSLLAGMAANRTLDAAKAVKDAVMYGTTINAAGFASAGTTIMAAIAPLLPLIGIVVGIAALVGGIAVVSNAVSKQHKKGEDTKNRLDKYLTPSLPNQQVGQLQLVRSGNYGVDSSKTPSTAVNATRTETLVITPNIKGSVYLDGGDLRKSANKYDSIEQRRLYGTLNTRL